MTLETATGPRSMHEEVLLASAMSYEAHGERVIPHWQLNGHRTEWVPDLFIPALRRIEQVVTLESLSDLKIEQLAKFRESGLEVWILGPIGAIGRLHSELRGVADRIQGWWIHEGRVLFEAPRLP